MLKLILLSVSQALLMCTSQSLFKMASYKLGAFSWTWQYFHDGIFTNWWLLGSGAAGIVGLIEWTYMLRNYPFSQVYPLSSLSFLFGMFVSVLFFRESVVWQQWVGVFLILGGCALIAR